MSSNPNLSAEDARTADAILKSIRAKLHADGAGNGANANPDDPARIASVLEYIQQQLQRDQAAQAAVAPPSADPPDLSRLHAEVDAALVAHRQVGQLNPRLPGIGNNAVQLIKKTMRRSLSWYTRPIHLYQGAVIRALQDVESQLQAIRSELPRLDDLEQELDAAKRRLQETTGSNGYWDPNFGPPAWQNGLPRTATQSDILYCFRLLFGRSPSEQEWFGHSMLVGSDLRVLVSSYLNSQEFAGRHLFHRDLEQWEPVELPGFKMYASRADKLIGQTIIQTRDYEPEVSDIFRRYLQPGMHVLDVGANIGYFSLLAASLVGPTGSVHSWEPAPENVRALYAGGLLNKFTNIHITQAAASDAIGLLQYYPAFSSGNVASAHDATPEDILGCVTVMGLRIDDLLPPDLKIDLVKIDVEGFELNALRGALQMLQRSRPAIITEFCPASLDRGSKISGHDYLEFFAQLGYRISVITAQGPVQLSIAQVLSRLEESGTDHIDLWLQPAIAER